MKKLLYLIMAAATLLFAAGCQREKGLSDNDGRLADVTFRVALDGMQTKAFSDGTKADSLVVMVYKDNNGFEFLEKVEPVEKPEFDANLTAEVNLKLVRGETYRIVFWAMHNDPSLYIFDKENAAVTVNVDGLVSNDDERDAFYGVWNGTVGKNGVENSDVDLYRPFAQINVLTSAADWEAAINNGVIFAGSAMSVKAPTKLNFFDGSVDEPAVYEFAQADIDQDVNIPGYEDYKYIAMNYILTDEGSNVGETNDPLKIEVYRESGLLVDFDLVNVPVRRNYRTILVGDIFCADAIFQVTIQNEFGGDETIPLENAEDQVITFDPDSAPGQDPAFEYDEQSLTGEYTMTVGETLDFTGAFSSNSTFDPVYTSSDEAVGKFAAQVGDAPTLFTALAAGQTVVNLHFNAVINGEQVKSEIKNFKSADVNITITVVGLSVPTPMFEPGSVEEMTELNPEDPYVYLLIEDPEDKFVDAVIYYKTAENAEWTIYDDENPIEITEETTIWAYASMDGWEDSEVVWASFKLEEEITLGDPWTYTFEAKVFDANGQTKTLNGKDWTHASTGGDYFGYDATKGQQFGKKADPATALSLTSNFGATYGVEEVVVNASGAADIEATLSVTVGNAVLKCNGEPSVALSSTATDYSFVIEEGEPVAGDIVISFAQTSSKAIYVKTISVNPNAGGDEPTVYAIEIDDVQNGTIESDPASEAEEGATVTLTLTPDNGYVYLEDSLEVLDENQEPIDVEVNASPSGDGVFVATFTMPACDVFVTASFEEEAEPGDTYAIEIDDVQNGSIVSDPASEAEEGATVTLTITPDDGYAYVEQSLQVIAANQSVVEVEVNASLAAQGVYEASFTMPACDVLVTAAFEEEQPQETFTSNVEWTVSSDTKSYDNNVLNVNNVSSVANIKLGTGSAYGSASITLPAGTKSVSFYAVAWNGKSSNLRFTVGNDAFELAIAGNSGATGNTPYTISVTDSDKYSFQFDQALESETEITVETYGGTDKRAFLFAINAVVEEGGDVPVAAGIEIDGDFDDWEDIDELASDNGGTGRIRNPWQFASDDDNLYFHFILRKEKMRTAYMLSLIFDWDESGSYTADNLSGGELCVKIQPFTNETGGTPACVNGTITTAEINGSTVENLSISVYGVDPDSTATGDTADYYLEMCIPKSCLPNLPEAGTEIKIGAGYEWYNTGLQAVTL